jgi:recombination protein RecT
MSQELTLHQQNVMGLRKLAESPAYLNRFKQVLNDRAPQFVASLVQVVSSSQYLAKCDPNTIMAAAITAAALDLPIDKNLGFAHIVPYKDQAQFQMGYKGFVQLAVRTGQYKFLNCCVVRKGELVKYDELTGEVIIDQSKRESEEAVGYAAYFKLMNGYEHAEYWTKAEVEDHARRYSKAFGGNYETPWKTNFDAMALKTVIKSLLSHWGIMSVQMQQALKNDQGVRKTPDSDDVAYPDNEPKRPVMEGPTVDVEAQVDPAETARQATATAAAIDAAAIDNPYGKLQEFSKRDGVTDAQILGFMKANKLALTTTEELAQTADKNMREVVQKWAAVLPKIKAIKA